MGTRIQTSGNDSPVDNSKHKSIHIGRIDLSVGQAVFGAAGMALLLSGTGWAINEKVLEPTRRPPLSVASLAGNWERPGGKAMPGFTLSPMRLDISTNGEFHLMYGFTMSLEDPAAPPPATTNIECSGIVVASPDRFAFKATSGQCTTFEGTLSENGSVLDIGIGERGTNGSTALTKA